MVLKLSPVWLLAVLFCWTPVGAQEAGGSGWIQAYAAKSSKSTLVPKGLIAEIEATYRQSLKAQKKPADKINRKLLNVRVELTQDERRVLQGPTRIDTPLGGGEVDLSQVLTPMIGQFDMKIEVLDDLGHSISPDRVYFVSHSFRRKIGDKEFGAGCGVYMNVTDYFRERMKKTGFELYTAAQRYLPVIRGTFVLVGFLPDSLRMASLTFDDSRYPDGRCPQPSRTATE